MVPCWRDSLLVFPLPRHTCTDSGGAVMALTIAQPTGALAQLLTTLNSASPLILQTPSSPKPPSKRRTDNFPNLAATPLAAGSPGWPTANCSSAPKSVRKISG